MNTESHHKHPITSETRAPNTYWMPALGTATLCLFVEMIRAYRSVYWTGQPLSQWLGAFFGFVLYTALLAFFLRVLLWCRVQRWFALAGASLAVWGGLAAWSNMGRDALILLGGLLILNLIVRFMARNTAHPWRTQLALVIPPILSIVALHISANTFFIEEYRASAVTVCALTVFFVTGLAIGGGLLVRRPLTGAVLAVVLAVCLGFGAALLIRRAAPGNESSRPNLLLITADAMRAQSCSTYGGAATTNNLSYLANEGAFFERSYSLAPWTLPSFYGMFSSSPSPGLTPGLDFDAWKKEMRQYRFPQVATLAEQLRAEGYTTYALVGNSLLMRREGVLRGFDRAITMGHLARGFTGVWGLVPSLREVMAHVVPEAADEYPVDTTHVITQYAKSFLKRQGNRPFLLWVHYMDPHDPYSPPEAFAPAGSKWRVFAPSDPFWGTPQQETGFGGNINVAGDDKPLVQALYEGEIAYVDYRMGEILRTAERLGLNDNTFVCFTADHGEAFWEHGRYSHGTQLYDEQVHVPLVLRGPGIPTCRYKAPFSALHLVPTLAGLLGLTPDGDWRGTDYSEALRSGQNAQSFGSCYSNATTYPAEPGPMEMVVDNTYKLIRLVDVGKTGELYDLMADPHELDTLWEQRQPTAHRLWEMLDAWDSSFPSTLSSRSGTKEDDAELRERMEALGYLD